MVHTVFKCRQQYLWTKLVVPSMGSMIQVGLSVRTLGAPAATDSSPIKLQSHKERKQQMLVFRHNCHLKCKISNTIAFDTVYVLGLLVLLESVISDIVCLDWINIHQQSSIKYSTRAVHRKPLMSIFAVEVPVCRVLFLDGRYNKLLHFLVCLSHQVDWWAFLHDRDVFVERLADHLGETQWQTQPGDFLDDWLHLLL